MSTPIPVDSRQFRNALGSFTTGVTIVTTRDESGADVGLTANSFNSVSLDPPLVLWSLAKTSRSMDAFIAAEHFAVHVLAADQEPLSNLFASRGADKFAGLEPQRGAGGVPLLDGCAARFQCRTAFRYDGGDHEIFVGEVIAFDHFDKAPLAFHAGKYGVVLKTTPASAPAPVEQELESSFGTDFLGYLLGVSYQNIFRTLREELDRRDLRTDQYYLLNILGRHKNRSITELNALFSLVGMHVTPDLVLELAQRGLVRTSGEATPDAVVELTESGRQTMIELVSIAKASEVNAERSLDFGERLMLKDLLRRVIRDTNPGPPPGWRKGSAT